MTHSENLVQDYTSALENFVNHVEHVYPYTEEPLNKHMACLTLIIGAALSEFAKLENVTQVSIDTLNTLLPKTIEDGLQQPRLSKQALMTNVADKVAKFSELLGKVEPNAAVMSKLSMQMQLEMNKCRSATAQLEASPEWHCVTVLASVKLLSDVMERAVELDAKPGPKPR